jgi:hypothetical protein
VATQQRAKKRYRSSVFPVKQVQSGKGPLRLDPDGPLSSVRPRLSAAILLILMALSSPLPPALQASP